MMRYSVKDAPRLLALARQDTGLTQKVLADRSGIHQPVISAIENGRRPVSQEMLLRLLTSAQMRPAVPLEFYASAVLEAAHRHRIDVVRVFGSVIHGLDTVDSGVDLLVTLAPDASVFDLAGFRQDAERIIGFPVDVVPDDADNPVVKRALMEAIPPMNDHEGQHPHERKERFQRIPRVKRHGERLAHAVRDHKNLIDELSRIRSRLTIVTDRGRERFFDEEDETNFLAAQAIIINFDDAASGRIPDSVKARFPRVPWGGISGMRNLLAHDHRAAQKHLVWKVATNELPRLLDDLLAEGVI